MHEYRLTDDELKIACAPLDAFVLCRIFRKSGTGPKNGEQYGAPYVEEEWEEDTMTFVPKQDARSDGLADDDEKPENLVVYEAIPVQTNYCHGESSNNVESGNNSDSGNYIQPGNYVVECGGYFEQRNETFEEDQKPIIRDGSIQPCSLLPDGVQDENAVNLEASSDNVFVADACYSDIPIDDANYMPDEPFIDHSNNLPLSDGLYLETKDLSGGLQDDFNFEDYLNLLEDEDTQSLDVSQLLGSQDALPNQEGLDQKPSPEELEKKESGEGSSSKLDADVTDFDSASEYPPVPQKGESHVCSTFICFVPVPNKGRCNQATRGAIFRFSSRYCRYDENIKHDSSSG